MSSGDPTIAQNAEQQARSQELSLQRAQPPAQVPGYDLDRFLGMGAYGEVWVAIERNTGRQVAIKFYSHRGGLDWSLLSREVEKLAFLFADRYVVQLIGVGWDADPPYYVMEYLDRGSLAERLHQGPMPVAEAVDVFHEVAVGLMHAHGKGVLHCDLKPANVLLDQDNKPRLADFGQSRLSHEQTPALGTLFYMAPEQADLNATPDVRWDVYALGALLYCMLTGHPPHRDDKTVAQLEEGGDLERRLSRYRHTIRRAPPPREHWRVPGVDRALAEILDGCLAVQPEKRYPNVQAVLDALHTRAVRRARRPMMVVGAVGPVLLLAVVSLFAWWGFGETLRRSTEALTERALESNRFAAQYVARTAGTELEARWRAVEQLASLGRMQELLAELTGDRDVGRLLERLRDPHVDTEELETLQHAFRDHPKLLAFQREFNRLIAGRLRPQVSSWFVSDAHGVQLARLAENPQTPTIGKVYSWRSYFHGLGGDMPETWRPGPQQHIRETTLSHVYLSQANNLWMVAIAAPIRDEEAHGQFRGVLGLTIEVGRFMELQGDDQQFAVLADWREGENQGMILQHPLFNKLRNEQGTIPERFKDYRLAVAALPASPERARHYVDPLSADPEGGEYARPWLAQMEPVSVRGRETGWIVIVQESYDEVIGLALARLETGLLHWGLAALGMIVVLILALWAFAVRLLNESLPRSRIVAPEPASESSATPNSTTETAPK